MKSWIIALVVSLWGLGVFAQNVPLIDTHSHFQPVPGRDFNASARSALDTMDRFGFERTILMPPPFDKRGTPIFYDIEQLVPARDANPGRVSLIGGSTLNVMIHQIPAEDVTDNVKQRFSRRAEAILAQGAVGFGEIAIHHVSVPAMGPQHPYENIPATHPLLLLLVDIAAEHDVPIDLHFDLVPEDMPLPSVLRPNTLNPTVLKANDEAFRALLSHNPRARLIWSHVGFEPLLTRQPDRVRNFLRDFPNLYMSFRLSNGSPQSASVLDSNGTVKREWISLVSEFSERFLLGSDAFYSGDGIARGASEQTIQSLRRLIDVLPPQAGFAVGRGNAIRLFKLAGQ